MKKFLIISLVLMMLFSLAGCTNGTQKDPPSSGDASSEGGVTTPEDGSSEGGETTTGDGSSEGGETNTEATASLTYERNSDGYTVTGETENVENITIPDQYNGLPVTAIGESAFAYSKHTAPILSVTIPDSVTTIANNAFFNRSEMTTVNIGRDSQLKEIGRNAFSGNHALTAIYIPSGVTIIGDSAFNNNGSINFTVDEANTVYRSENGHLIETATQTLIRGGQSADVPESVTSIAQAAFRKSTLTEINLPSSVTKIENSFIADSSISVIHFSGTEEQWNAIEKGSLWNYRKKDIEVRFAE